MDGSLFEIENRRYILNTTLLTRKRYLTIKNCGCLYISITFNYLETMQMSRQPELICTIKAAYYIHYDETFFYNAFHFCL